MTTDSKSIPNWPQLFTGSANGQDGSEGCIQTGAPYNGNWQDYFTAGEDSISITAGDDARTVSTDNNLNFNLGTGGVTQITFDFEITNYMNTNGLVTWLAFWIYSNPWSSSAEVDFVDFGSVCGMGKHGFAKHGMAHAHAIESAHQLAIHPGFHTVCVARCVQGFVGRHHVRHDPGAVLCWAWRMRAGVNDGTEGVVYADCTLRLLAK